MTNSDLPLGDDRADAHNLYFDARVEALGPLADCEIARSKMKQLAQGLYGSADLFSLYGRNIDQLSDDGFQILGRTVVEACIDHYTHQITQYAWDFFNSNSMSPGVVIDLFAGSGNMLDKFARTFNTPGFGFEANARIFSASSRNLQLSDSPAVLMSGPYDEALTTRLVADKQNVIFIIDPPWADGFDRQEGLDLRRTEPPITDLLPKFAALTADRAGFVIRSHKDVQPQGIRDIKEFLRPLEIFPLHGKQSGSRATCMVGISHPQ